MAAQQLGLGKRGINAVWKFFGQEAVFKNTRVAAAADSFADSIGSNSGRRQAFMDDSVMPRDLSSPQVREESLERLSSEAHTFLRNQSTVDELLKSLPTKLEDFKGRDLSKEDIAIIVSIITNSLSNISAEEQITTRTKLETDLRELNVTEENLSDLKQFMQYVDPSLSSHCQRIMTNFTYNYYMQPQKKSLEDFNTPKDSNIDVDELYIVIQNIIQTAIKHKLAITIVRKDLQDILLKLNLTEDNLKDLTNKLQQDSSPDNSASNKAIFGTIIKGVADVLEKQKADKITPILNQVQSIYTSLGRDAALMAIYSFIKDAINEQQSISTVTDFLEKLRTQHRELKLTKEDFTQLLNKAAQEFLGQHASISADISEIYQKINVFLETIQVIGNPGTNMQVIEEDANGKIDGIRAPQYQEDLMAYIKKLQSQSTTNNSFNSMALVILYSRLSDYASQIQLEGVTRTSQIQEQLIASLHKDTIHFKQGLLQAPADVVSSDVGESTLATSSPLAVRSDDPVGALMQPPAGVFSPKPLKKR